MQLFRFNLKSCRRVLYAGLIVLLTVANVSSPASAASLIKIDGSSTVFPISEAVAEEFQKSTRGAMRVTVGISGTGGGFKKFCRGETDIQDASRPIMAEEMQACREQGIEFYELPVAYDAMTIVVSPQNTWVETITLPELKKMWQPSAQGTVMKWSQVRPSWPDHPLKLFGAGSDSGTFDYFTEAVVGKPKASRGDYTASEDDNTLVQGVSRDKYALGYLPYAYYQTNTKKLKALAVDNGDGPVLPSRRTVEEGTYQPLSRPVFIYVNRKSAERPDVKQFVEFYLTQAAALVEQIKYVPLPERAYRLVLQNFQSKKLGTAFQGATVVGVKIEDLLRRETKL